MPNNHTCSTINTNTELKNCYTCLDSTNTAEGCFWSDDYKSCSAFQGTTYYNKSSDNYDASTCVKPELKVTNSNDECSADTDCTDKTGGKCFYNNDYENPVKKCNYSCASDTDCTGTGETCFSRGGISSNKYCAVPDKQMDDNNDNRTCSTDTDCTTDEICRTGWSGVKLCASKNVISSYSSEGNNYGFNGSSDSNSSSTDSSSSYNTDSTDNYNSQIEQNQKLEEQLLNDIQSLQGVEKDLFSSLDDQTLTDEKKADIMAKINSVSEMRLNLYSTLNDINGYFTTLNTDSSNSMSDQSSAIKIIEDQLNKTKQSLMDYQTDKNNKIRLIEINSYYSQRYSEHSDLMKIAIYTLAPIILLTFLNNNGLLPYNIFVLLIVIIGLFGGFLFVNRLASIWSRDSINYQEYLWSFNKKSAPVPVVTTSENSDPWGLKMPLGFGTCIGSNCCSSDTVWNETTNTCDLE